MRALVVLALVAGCGDDNPPTTCKPEGPYILPPASECEVADCRGVNCDATCETGNTCGTLDCRNSPQCRLDCQPAATCTFTDCTGADVCFIACHGDASVCEAACAGAAQC